MPKLRRVIANSNSTPALIQNHEYKSHTARLTRSSEPILFPKLRIRFADFPYLHYPKWPEAVNLGDLLRIWVRPSGKINTIIIIAYHNSSAYTIFQGPKTAHGTMLEPHCFTFTTTLSSIDSIPRSRWENTVNLQRKDNSSPGCRRRHRACLRYRQY